MVTENWERVFREAGAFWQHDRKPDRPYARTKEGVSNGYFNSDRLTRTPSLVARAAGHLVHDRLFVESFDATPGALMHVTVPQPPTSHSDAQPAHVEPQRKITVRVVGAAYGAITLGHEVARHLGGEFAFAIKKGSGLSLERFRKDFAADDIVVLVEDTVTSGGTLRLLAREVLRVAPKARIVPCVLAFCNRSGKKEVEGRQIVSLVAPLFLEWKDGDNPFTPDRQELVPPVRPKEDDNWEILTRP